MSLVKSSKFPLRAQYNLLAEMVRTDFKLRYQASMLGYVWSILKPLFLFAILYTVFNNFLKLGEGVPNYALSLLLGIVLWTFFAEATNGALKSVVQKGGLMRKITIPRYLIPIAPMASAFINMLLNLIVVFIFVSFGTNVAVSWSTLIIFPILIIELALIVAAVGYFLAAIYVRLRDVDYIYEVFRQGLFYAIPIIWPITRAPEFVQSIAILNPITQVIQDARSVITYSGTESIVDLYGNAWIYAVPLGFISVALLIAIYVFHKSSKHFAENV